VQGQPFCCTEQGTIALLFLIRDIFNAFECIASSGLESGVVDHWAARYFGRLRDGFRDAFAPVCLGLTLQALPFLRLFKAQQSCRPKHALCGLLICLGDLLTRSEYSSGAYSSSTLISI
jgi:hypothetical protein